MSELVVRTCSRCHTTARQVPLGVLVSEPKGWATVTVGGLPVCNRYVCPSCARAVRNFLEISPLDQERRLDLSREVAWRDGYEEGCNETEKSAHVCSCAAETPAAETAVL